MTLTIFSRVESFRSGRTQQLVVEGKRSSTGHEVLMGTSAPSLLRSDCGTLSHLKHRPQPLSMPLNANWEAGQSLWARQTTRTSVLASLWISSDQMWTFTSTSFSWSNRKSPQAHLHVVEMLRFKSFTKTSRARAILLVYSCVYFCHYSPFNCISFHKVSEHFSAFSFLSSGLISA